MNFLYCYLFVLFLLKCWKNLYQKNIQNLLTNKCLTNLQEIFTYYSAWRRTFDLSNTRYFDWWLMEIYACRPSQIELWKQFLTSFYILWGDIFFEGKKKDARVSVSFQLRTPHLVNGFLFALHLIGSIFSSLWADGFRLTFFSSLRSFSHLKNDDGFQPKNTTNPPKIPQSEHRWFHHTHSMLLHKAVINWISSFETRTHSHFTSWHDHIDIALY